MNEEEVRNKAKESVDARRKEDKEKVLGELRKMPIVSVACDRASISRWTYYRWRSEDKEFAKAADEAIHDGELLICDMGETQLVSLMRDKHFPAIMAYLRSHHPKYATKVELTAQLKTEKELTPEQEALVEKALKYVAKQPGVSDAGKDDINDQSNNK